MKVNIIKNWAGWRHVLSIAEKIENETEDTGSSEISLYEYLDSIEIALGDKPDPVSEVQEFALLKLCRAVKKSLIQSREN